MELNFTIKHRKKARFNHMKTLFCRKTKCLNNFCFFLTQFILEAAKQAAHYIYQEPSANLKRAKLHVAHELAVARRIGFDVEFEECRYEMPQIPAIK